MRITFRKINRIAYQAFEYDDNLRSYTASGEANSYCLFSVAEIKKINSYLKKRIKKFKASIIKNHEYSYYTVIFYNKEDEDFFLVLTADGIDI
jgi:hypothetical protein